MLPAIIFFLTCILNISQYHFTFLWMGFSLLSFSCTSSHSTNISPHHLCPSLTISLIYLWPYPMNCTTYSISTHTSLWRCCHLLPPWPIPISSTSSTKLIFIIDQVFIHGHHSLHSPSSPSRCSHSHKLTYPLTLSAPLFHFSYIHLLIMYGYSQAHHPHKVSFSNWGSHITSLQQDILFLYHMLTPHYLAQSHFPQY